MESWHTLVNYTVGKTQQSTAMWKPCVSCCLVNIVCTCLRFSFVEFTHTLWGDFCDTCAIKQDCHEVTSTGNYSKITAKQNKQWFHFIWCVVYDASIQMKCIIGILRQSCYCYRHTFTWKDGLYIGKGSISRDRCSQSWPPTCLGTTWDHSLWENINEYYEWRG